MRNHTSKNERGGGGFQDCDYVLYQGTTLDPKNPSVQKSAKYCISTVQTGMEHSASFNGEKHLKLHKHIYNVHILDSVYFGKTGRGNGDIFICRFLLHYHLNIPALYCGRNQM